MKKSGHWQAGLGLLAVLSLFAVACTTEIGDIDHTKPDKLKKADLKGIWFYAQTVIEAPVPNAVTFDGDYNGFPEPTKVMFDIEESYLIVYPVTELTAVGSEEKWTKKKIRNYWDEGKQDEFIEMYVGQPLAAFKIDKHFDVKRDYNAATGDQGNVLTENDTDRKWWEREYIRVNWSDNAVEETYFLVMLETSPVSYYVQEYEVDNPDRPDISESAINVVTKMYADPVSPTACSIYDVAPYDCAGAIVKVRHSFKKANPNEDYVPLFYDPDNRMGKFGFFMTERYGYDEDYGLIYSAKKYLIHRWNIWEQSRTAVALNDENGEPIQCYHDEECKEYHDGQVHCWLDDGWFSEGHCVTWDSLPYDQRPPKPIVYFVSADWPQDLLQSAYDCADNWSKAFREAVAWAKFYAEKKMMDVQYCEKDADCMSGKNAVLDASYADTHPRFCDPNAAIEEQNEVCQYQLPPAEKSMVQCTAAGECVTTIKCDASAPCATDEACFSGVCYTCPTGPGTCALDNKGAWAMKAKTIMNRGRFSLYYLVGPDGKDQFRMGIDDPIPYPNKDDCQFTLNVVHLAPNLGNVKLAYQEVGGKETFYCAALNADGEPEDIVYSYQAEGVPPKPGAACTLAVAQDEETKECVGAPTLNFSLVDAADPTKVVGVYNYVTVRPDERHTFLLGGDSKGSFVTHGVALHRFSTAEGLVRFVHAARGRGAMDVGLNGSQRANDLSFGEFSPYTMLAYQENRVVALPHGTSGEVTCYHQGGVGMCMGWKPELMAADMARVQEILNGNVDKDGNVVAAGVPPMFVACEAVYTGDACSQEEIDAAVKANATGQTKSLPWNDCRNFYKDEAGNLRNPCGEVPDPHSVKKHGDLRYSQMYWVPEDQVAAPLGLGPSFADPDTGMLHYGIAHIYGAAMVSYGQYAKDLLDASLGKLSKQNLMTADYVKQYIEQQELKDQYQSLYAPLPSRDEMQKRQADRLAYGKPVKRFWATPEEKAKLAAFKQQHPEMLRLLFDPREFWKAAQASLPPTMTEEQLSTRFQKIGGTWLEDLLTTQETKNAVGGLNGALTPEQLAAASPLSWAAPEAAGAEQERLRLLASRNYDSADMIEPNVYATAKEAEEWCGKPENLEKFGGDVDRCLVNHVTQRMLNGTVEHEVGHTIGLRHNFGGSVDVFNYRDEYYAIREKDIRKCYKEGVENDPCAFDGECVISCESDADCLVPGTSCQEVEDEEGEKKMGCVDVHMEPVGYCKRVQRIYVDCQTDGECGPGARCRLRPEEKWGICEAPAVPDENGICPEGLMVSGESCIDGAEYCNTQAKRCGVDASRACATDQDCQTVYVPVVEVKEGPVMGYGLRPYMTPAEKEGNRVEYQHSSIMDYGGTINFELHGPGKWDEAAVRFGYTELSDVYSDTDKMDYNKMRAYAWWGGSEAYTSDWFMDSQYWADNWLFHPFFFLEEMLGEKENLDRIPVPYRKVELEYAANYTGDRGVWDISYRQVPYVNSTDMWVPNLQTYMFDIGADQGEIMEHAWNKLHEYYVFDAFKRERWAAYRGANPMGYYNRIKSRWLPPYEDVGRLGAIIFNLFRPWPEFMDLINWNELVGRKWVEWTERALRDLTQMITSPAPGSFKLVDKGTENERYQNFSYQTGEPGSELDIFIGDGKFPYTTYWDGAGYYYFDHAAWVGSFWEKMAALDTLTYSMGYFLSNYMGEQVDVGVGTSVGFNTTHYTELTNLLAGFLVGDRDYYAPYVEQGSVRFIDPVRPWESWGKPRVEPSIEGLAMQAYMGLFGCAYVQSGFDPGFVDAVYVCIKGSGNCYEIVTDENPEDGVTGVQTIEYYDEWSKKTYLARTANYDPVRINGSYALLQEANALKGEYDDIEWGESPETDAKKMELQAQLGNMRDLLDVLVTLNEIFGLMHY